MKVALTGDVALELIAPYFREAGYDVYTPAGFGTWRQELLDESSGLRRFAPDFIFDVTAHDAALSKEVSGFFDERMRKIASMPYSIAGIKAIVDEFEFFRIAAPKKVLAVDADNTLWRGILSEDGKDALVPCVEFQKGLKALRDRGVVLVLVSKNDPAESFMRDDMPLKDSDFAVRRINWSPKAGNIIEACKTLNLGLDSVVFVDDNPHERAQMAAHLPEVTVAPWNGWGAEADAELETKTLLRRLEEYFFSGVGATAEDRLRAASYAASASALETRKAHPAVLERQRRCRLPHRHKVHELADAGKHTRREEHREQFIHDKHAQSVQERHHSGAHKRLHETRRFPRRPIHFCFTIRTH